MVRPEGMTNLIDSLSLAPHNLGKSDCAWVTRTYAQLPVRKRLAQLFNVMLKPQSADDLARLAEAQPGAFTQYMMDGLAAGLARAKALAAASSIPLLVSADVEGGAIALEGCSPMNNQLGMAAMNDAALYQQALEVMAAEARALGIRWTFTPVLDINAEHRSAIVARRSFGSNPQVIEQLARLHVRTLQGQGLAATAYHPESTIRPGGADLVVFLRAQESLLTKSNIYLDWAAMLGPVEKAMDRSWHEIPTLLISFSQPYYLYDAPRMPCVINAYAVTEPVQRAVVRKLLGDEPFTGVSPVDAFCGLEDARF